MFFCEKEKGGAASGVAKEANANFQEGRKQRECINTSTEYIQMMI